MDSITICKKMITPTINPKDKYTGVDSLSAIVVYANKFNVCVIEEIGFVYIFRGIEKVVKSLSA